MAANLHTSKKSANQLDAITNYGYDKISSWTKRELHSLQSNSELPICVALQNGDYTVATYYIKKCVGMWAVNELEFNSKLAAIYYCSLCHLARFMDAEQIYRLDRTIGNLEFDKMVFRDKLDAAHLLQDQFKIDLYSSRFDETKRKLAVAKQDFTKKMSQAKYIYTEVLGN
jgi:hypothetical protein